MNSDDRAAYLISSLGLSPHPEGGFFREVFRSASRVQTHDARPKRPALTTIYYLLTRWQMSRWHRVASDEVWHFHEGAPLELFVADAPLETLDRHLLGPAGDAIAPAYVIPADSWQAARSTGAYTLVGCTVAPGFEFEDFMMLRDDPAGAAVMLERHPEMATFV
jgi:hypothetical protein